MTPVDDPRERKCIRCGSRFLEKQGTITRICHSCKLRTPRHTGAAGAAAPTDHVFAAEAAVADDADARSVVERSRERTCLRCGSRFVEKSGEITRVCRGCKG